MPTDQTGRVARAYHDAWTNRKGPEALRELMAEEFVFDSAMMHLVVRDGRLTSSEVVVDGAAFMAFMTG
jgi:hypothetical protein